MLINADRGSSWRNIGGGRPAFSIPELAEIARNNQTIFEETQKEYDIHYREIRYITFAHDEATYNDLERSCGWVQRLFDRQERLPERGVPLLQHEPKHLFRRTNLPALLASYPGACDRLYTKQRQKSGKVRFWKTHT